MHISSISVIKTTERKAAMWLVNFSCLLVGICKKKIDIYYSGYIQTHCQQNKKIKRADQILPEVYGTTLNGRKRIAMTAMLSL
jgi:hypothetical protein